jgi:hypothetical protein
MLITRCRQLPDGEELVWAEDGSFREDGLDPRSSDPRECSINRRGLALSQTSGRRTVRPASDSRPSSSIVGRVKLTVEWR